MVFLLHVIHILLQDGTGVQVICSSGFSACSHKFKYNFSLTLVAYPVAHWSWQ